MRGKHPPHLVGRRFPGITPADAGKTLIEGIVKGILKDHPRGCGENCIVSGASAVVRGSPPRMRGKLRQLRQCSQQSGITPADAGKTECVEIAHCKDWDHPRGCGENLPTIIIEIVKSGSPPRMRGKLGDSIRLSPSA